LKNEVHMGITLNRFIYGIAIVLSAILLYMILDSSIFSTARELYSILLAIAVFATLAIGFELRPKGSQPAIFAKEVDSEGEPLMNAREKWLKVALSYEAAKLHQELRVRQLLPQKEVYDVRQQQIIYQRVVIKNRSTEQDSKLWQDFRSFCLWSAFSSAILSFFCFWLSLACYLPVEVGFAIATVFGLLAAAFFVNVHYWRGKLDGIRK